MINYLLKRILLPIFFILGMQQLSAQWTNVLVENFNNRTGGSTYPLSGVSGYWANGVNPPQNNVISSSALVGSTTAYTSQIPSDAAGGRFLVFWTNVNSIPASENTFFKKTVAVIPGRTYRTSFSYVAFNTLTPANITLRAMPTGSTTAFYTSATTTVSNVNWANSQYTFVVPAGVTSMDLTWENTVKTTNGNDFGLDNILVEQAVDSDGDGVPDYIDLDDDNDGILDTIEDACDTEGAPVYNNNFGTGDVRGQDTNVLSHTYAGTGAIGDGFYALTTSAAASELYNKTDLTGNLDAGNPVITAGTTSGRYLMININSPGTVNQPIYRVSNLAVNVGTRYKFRIDMAGLANGSVSIPNLQLSIRDVNGNFLASANSGSINMANDDVWRRLSLAFTATTSTVILEIINLQPDGNGNDVGIDNVILTPIIPCDSDGDGIPNSQDLDSDGDGCTDAIEGGANFTTANLVTATGTISSQTPNQNLGNTVGSTATTLGIPIIAGTGQAIGQSQNAVRNDCIDSDGDGIPDWQDLDDDNDGITDCVENGLSGVTVNNIFTLRGSATQISNIAVSLTPDALNQAGQMWSNGKVDFAKSFSLSYVANLGSKDATGADGMAAVFHNSPLGTNAVGGSAFGMGAVGIQNGIVLELDTWDNGTAYGDIPNDHGQIWVASSQIPANYLTAAADLGNLENGLNHNVVITWNAVTKNLSYTVNGLNAGSYTFPPATPITSYFGGVSKVYFGFTASTGSASNNQLVGFNNFCTDLPIELDTDGDGIPDYLDLDSDGDGCPDAIEGGANFTTANLVTATGTISSQTPNQNLGNTVGNTVTTIGVPTISGTGQGIGQSQNAGRNDCIDTDGDGVPDWQDLDNDNDGILDIDENCNPFLAQNVAGVWKGKTVSNLTVNIPGSSTQPDVNEISDGQNKYHINQSGATTRVGRSGNISFTYTFSTPVPANEIAFFLLDLDPQFGSVFPTYQFSVNGGPVNGSFDSVTFGGISPYMTFNSVTGLLTVADRSLADYRVLLKGRGNQLISSITITSTGITGGDSVAYSLFALNECDTDGDGIPNRLDLDSDNDGCSDAIEGGADISTTQLVTAGGALQGGNGINPVVTPTSGTYNQAILVNLCNTVSCVNTQGVPQLTTPPNYNNTSGQTIGQSQNSTINTCVCYNDANFAGTGTATNHGITLLQRAGTDNGNWPMIRIGGFTALESNSKGLVITRIPTSGFANITNPVDGMMVYDTTANCLKIYTVEEAPAVSGWKCYLTPACP